MELTLKETREKLGAKQDELGKIFGEAKTSDGQVDFNKVSCLGAEVKGSIAVAEKVQQLTAECNDLAEKAEKLEAAEKAMGDYADREKARRNWALPGAQGKGGGSASPFKSLGALVTEEKAYTDWVASGSAGGVSLNFSDLSLSDVLSSGSLFETIGNKALMTTTAGFAPESFRLPGFVEAVARPIQLLDIIPMGRTGVDAVPYMEETTRTHAAAEKAEGGTYAESTFVFTEKSSAVRKITDSVPVTDEQLEDVPLMESYINGRLTFGVRQRLDGQCLVGDGTAPNLRGIKNVAGIQTQAKAADPVPDAFFKAMTKIRLVGRALPTHHVMHPTDWQNIRLLRTVDGVYIWGNPSEAGVERLWGLPVIQCDADAVGTGYVGSFQPAWISLFERKGVDVQVGFVGTQFTEGKRTVRADTRSALAVFRPAAFCSVTGL